MNQTLLINCYARYKYLIKNDFNIHTEYNFSGFIDRVDTSSGKLKDEFYLFGKYYGYFGGDKSSDIAEFIDSKKVLVIDCTYTGFHYHFCVPHVYVYELEIVKNKLYYNGVLINEKILDSLNKGATEYYKQNYKFVYEKYVGSNNFICL